MRAVLLYALGNIGNNPEAISQANAIAQRYIKSPSPVDGSLADAAVKVAARTVTQPSTPHAGRN
jgi:hypothetical protein